MTPVHVEYKRDISVRRGISVNFVFVHFLMDTSFRKVISPIFMKIDILI